MSTSLILFMSICWASLHVIRGSLVLRGRGGGCCGGRVREYALPRGLGVEVLSRIHGCAGGEAFTVVGAAMLRVVSLFTSPLAVHLALPPWGDFFP